MLEQFGTKNLFQLQSELIDRKIEMTVSNSIDRVMEELRSFRLEMARSFEKVSEKIQHLQERVTAVETKLGMVNERQKELRNRFFDYGFKATWLGMGAALIFIFLHLTQIP